MSGPQGDHLFGKPGNVREFDRSVGEKSSQENCLLLIFLNYTSVQ